MYYKKTLDQIRSSVIQALSSRNLTSGSDFKVASSDIKQPILYVYTGTSNRGSVYVLEEILKETFGSLILIERINSNSLLLNVSKLYFQIQRKDEIKKPDVKEIPIVIPDIDPFTLEPLGEKRDQIEELLEGPKINVKFTNEEQRVFELLCEWRPRTEITNMTGLLDNQFTKIRESIYLKLGVKDVTRVIIFAYKNGLLPEDNTLNEKVEFSDIEKKIITEICKGSKFTLMSVRLSRPLNMLRIYHKEIIQKINGRSSADIIIYALKHKLFP